MTGINDIFENSRIPCGVARRLSVMRPQEMLIRKRFNGTILAAITKGEHGGEAFDREYPKRIKATIY